MDNNQFNKVAETIHLDGLRISTYDEPGNFSIIADFFSGGEKVQDGPLAPFELLSTAAGDQVTPDSAKRLEYVLDSVARYYDMGGDLKVLAAILDRMAERLPPLDFPSGVSLVAVETEESFVYTLGLPDGRYLRVFRDSTYEFLSPSEMIELGEELGYRFTDGSETFTNEEE